MLKKLREQFLPTQIGKLPKPTNKQTLDLKNNPSLGIKCQLCGGWHHKDVIHLDYVGHAALTDRLLDTDEAWYWEPMAFDESGLPKFDENGGLWIRLHVLGVSRIGYGNAPHSDYKDIGAREKEVIGDALRNAAMRFGAALELWHKGTLKPDHLESDGKKQKPFLDERQTQIKDYLIQCIEEQREEDAYIEYDALSKMEDDLNAIWPYINTKQRNWLKPVVTKFRTIEAKDNG